MLTASMLYLFNMARGEGKLPHWAWLVVATWVIYCQTLNPLETALWAFVAIIVTMRATKPILIGINGDPKAIWNGFIRNLPIVPALVILHSWAGLALLLQGGLYYCCRHNTRLAEGITGLVIGLSVSLCRGCL